MTTVSVNINLEVATAALECETVAHAYLLGLVAQAYLTLDDKENLEKLKDKF